MFILLPHFLVVFEIFQSPYYHTRPLKQSIQLQVTGDHRIRIRAGLGAFHLRVFEDRQTSWWQKRYLLRRWHRYTQYLVYTATLGARLLPSAPPLRTHNKLHVYVCKTFCDITFETSSYSIHLVSIYWLSVALQGLLVWNWRGKKS